MKIQLGVIQINRTKKYLLPCLKEYGPEFEKRIANLFKLGVGIGHIALADMGIDLKKHIFILVDTKLSRKFFKETIAWLRIQDYYETDYPFDDIHRGHLHMIVVKLPKKYYQAYGRFKQSQFGDMYEYEDLVTHFKGKEELKVLTRDEQYKVEFVELVNGIYKTTVSPEEWTGELDFPIKLEEEIFK